MSDERAAGGERSADATAEMQAFVDRHGYLSWLGVTVEAVERGRLVMSVPYDEKLVNPDPDGTAVVHGGIAATLVDTASGFVLRTTFEDPAEAALTTTDLNVSYLRPATGDLRAEAEVVRAGGSMGVTEVTVTSERPGDEEATEVAVGRASYRLFRGETT
ncbi:PaaI family thioesterase [Halorussus sp. MSC15.2]|uniref:PaaI family thioesterase n=1 Tax=Halorussus sp. MSC15.2 TaxID=2283638 RepID=UPI0013D7ACDD|nr:PaaI family thioesterase [Halorussus sp. MSC15.2]NEU57776.1 PaaI family thioesterase [Halorussus sp. MSC15.2]